MRKILSLLLLTLIMFLGACDLLSKDKNVDDENIDTTYNIEDIINKESNLVVKVNGTVSATNEVGFILTDSTGSIFVKHNEDSHSISLGDTVTVSGTFQTNQGFEIVLDSFSFTENSIIKSTPTNVIEEDINNYVTSFSTQRYFTKHITIDAKVLLLDSNIVLEVGSHKLYLDKKAVSDAQELSPYINSTVSLTCWIYKFDLNSNLIVMINKVNYKHNNEDVVGNAPQITVKESYYHYLNTSDVNDLKSYFTISDVEDGIIEVTDSMISGEISVGQNIITLIVNDSDNNTSICYITIEIGTYTGFKNDESIISLDEYVCPSTGNIKALVIPISFNGRTANDTMRQNIQKAFFGTESETDWESLKSYYSESSYGKLNIDGTVTNWYTPKNNEAYYAEYKDEDNYCYGSTKLMVEALEYFKNTYNYANYDSNKDGYIDAVYLVYNTPIGGNGTQVQEDFYWAYTSWDINVDNRNYADTKGYSYVFISYDFFLEKLEYSNRKINLNCQTLIHETGHLFNLVDYYDYDPYDSYNNNGGYCAVDMMDYNIGDHGPLSKILLDWVDPVIINKSGIYQLPAFSTSGTTFLIGANGGISSIFDEYYLIDFYTFSGLNSLEIPSFFNTTKKYAGIRISHADATLEYEEGYFPIFQYDNTETKYKHLRLLEADYKGYFDLDKYENNGAELDDFYQVGQSFGNNYSNYKSHKNKNVPFILEVITMNESYATVKITFK